MTSTVTVPKAESGEAPKADGTLQAAVRYAEQGWPVLPGSIFDGRRYTVASTHRVTDGLRPVLPRDLASTDVRVIAQWWRVQTALAPSVLLRTGSAWDAVTVSRELAVEAVQTGAFRDEPGPVLLRPDQGMAYFLVGLGESVLPPEGARPTVVEPVEPGSWIAAPPTRTVVGPVSWLVPPRYCGWRPASAQVLAAALRVALPRTASTRW